MLAPSPPVNSLRTTDSDKRAHLRTILSASQGVLAPGVADPLFARLAEDCGYALIHMSGNTLHKSLCLPDSDMVTVTEIESRAARIADVTGIPLVVDLGTANRDVAQITRAVRLLERAGVSAIRIEDSYSAYSNSSAPSQPHILTQENMLDKIRAFVDARRDSNLLLVARCDSRRFESLAEVQERLQRYADAGADALGVQLSESTDFTNVVREARLPLVTLWPRRLMSASEFLELGVRVALLPSAISLAAVTAARRMLISLSETGKESDYLAHLSESDRKQSELWYRRVGDEFGRRP